MEEVKPYFIDSDWMDRIKEETIKGISPPRVRDIVSHQLDVTLSITMEDVSNILESILVDLLSNSGHLKGNLEATASSLTYLLNTGPKMSLIDLDLVQICTAYNIPNESKIKASEY